MKGSIEDLRQTIEGTAEEATAEAPETLPAEQRGGVLDMNDIIDEEVRTILEDRIRESIRSTFEKPAEEDSVSMSEAIKASADAIQDPEMKNILKQIWYGTDNITKDVTPNPQVPAETQNQQKNKDMFTGKDYSQSDYTPTPDELHQLMLQTLESAEGTDLDLTAEELTVNYGLIYSMLKNVSQMKPEMTVEEIIEYEQEHRDMFKQELEQMLGEL